jgi:AmmeMemoRadiSam system protein A
LNGAPLTCSPAERAFLKDLALRAVRAAAADEPAPDPAALAREQGLTPGPALLQERGAFVTLTEEGRLRGCIGTIEGLHPLMEAVAANARAAACRDPRFEPVAPAEVAGLELEVSALTPLVPVAGPHEIEVGRHGVLLTSGGHRAVFLPQVAPEQGWDRDTMLTHLALKAGLAPDGWRRNTRFEVFEAEVF